MKWFGSIFDAKESKDDETPKEGKDGNYTYGKSGTYDVYVKSDSESGHSHDYIDKDGNLLNNYHDIMVNRLFGISDEELSNIPYLSNEQCIMEIEKDLKAKTKIRRR